MNTQLLAGIRCPRCFQADNFAVQITMNVIVADDGFDFMGHRPEDDLFPGRALDPDDGLQDPDPIACAGRDGCGHRGTVKEFRFDW
ncbi:hypothetical protein [Saccharopolyspora shandongensis]|uniref:hypothetical protein n=1 Tax=Saccharopolyspora shandongensis TaxID=418495 RepID=UPI0034011E70